MILTYLVLGLIVAGATLLARGSARRLVAAGAISLLAAYLAMPFSVALGAFTRDTFGPSAFGLSFVAPVLWALPLLAVAALLAARSAPVRTAGLVGALAGLGSLAIIAWWPASRQVVVRTVPVSGVLEVVIPLALLAAALGVAGGLPRRLARPVAGASLLAAAVIAAALFSPSAGTTFDALRGYYKLVAPATGADEAVVLKDYATDLADTNADRARENLPPYPAIRSLGELPTGARVGRAASDAGVRRLFPAQTVYDTSNARDLTTYGYGVSLMAGLFLLFGGLSLARRGEEASEPHDLAGGATLAGVIAVLAASFNGVGFLLGHLFTGWPHIADFLNRSWPPDFAGFLSDTMKNMAVTLELALVGTALAALLALPLSLVAARTLTERSAVGRILYAITRVFFNIDRGIDTLIVALIFVTALGLGAFPGVLAVALHSIADLGKLYSEALENADRGPVEALEAAGAPGTSVVRWALLPQVLPLFISYTLYRFEINFRVSIVLGFVGAGGIGFLVTETMRAGLYPRAAVVILVIVATVNLLDFMSAAVRRRIT